MIQTKLAPPRRRTRLVYRPRLLNILSEGLTRTLTLMCAQAGYGKTTLLTDWIASRAFENDTGCSSIGWLSLDQVDNVANRFLRYLIAAFSSEDAMIKSKASSLLRAQPS